MEINLLRTFLEVRRLGNFRAAAERLHVTQAAVSQRVKHLETLLGAPLFVREKNNIRVTPAGEQFVPAAESIITTWSQARERIGRGTRRGIELIVAARPGLWSVFGNARLHDILWSRPEVSVRAESLGDDLATKRLGAQMLDLALLLAPPAVSGIEYRVVGTLELDLYSNPRKTLDEARSEAFVEVDWGRDPDVVESASCHVASPPRLRTSDHDIACAYIEKNGGVALLPASALGVRSRLRRVAGSAPITRRICAAWHPANPHAELLAAIVDDLQRTESCNAAGAIS